MPQLVERAAPRAVPWRRRGAGPRAVPRLTPKTLWVVALPFACLQGGVAQDTTDVDEATMGSDAAQATTGSDDEVVVAHKVFSPNPPKCAEVVSDAIRDIVEVSVRITDETSLCATATSVGYGTGPIGSGSISSSHRPLFCGESIVLQLAFWSRLAADLLSGSFNCFNNNQVCGQATSEIVRAFLEALTSLISADRFCMLPGVGPNPLPVSDEAGYKCFDRIWHAIARMFKMAKFIDVAVMSCPALKGLKQEQGVDAQPAHDNAEEGSAPGSSAAEGTDAITSDVDNATLGASFGAWPDLEQPRPFSMASAFKVAPVERRLRSVALVI